MLIPSKRFHRPAILVAGTGIYFLAGKLGLTMAFLNANISPVWPPTGLALAAMILLGYWVWPSIAIGSFLVNFTLSGSMPSSLIIAAGNVSEAVAAAWLISRFAKGAAALESPATLFRFTAAAGVASMLGATFGIAALSLGMQAPWREYAALWLTWWTGGMMSACMLAPLAFVWTRRPGISWNAAKVWEGVFLCAAVFLVGMMIFGGWAPAGIWKIPLVYLALPFLIWASFRYGQRGAVTLSFCFSVIAIRGTLLGNGPFAFQDANLSLLLLEAFLGTLFFTSVLLTSVLSAQKELERNLQISETKFRQVAENIREVFYICEFPEPAGKSFRTMVYVSPAYAEVWGRNCESLYSEPASFIDSLHVEDRLRMAEALTRQQRGEETREEYRIVRPDGTLRWVFDEAFPVRDGRGGVLRTVGVAMDITERKLTEERLRNAEDKLRQSHKMGMVGRLAGAIAHDVNNLLTAVNGYSEMLLGRLEKKDPCRQYAQEIKKAGEHATAVTRQLTAFSRKQAPVQVVLSINDVLADLQKLFRRLMRDDISLKLDCAQGLSTIEADAGQVGQIIMNLLFNARDAMSSGGDLVVSTYDAAIGDNAGDFILKPSPGTYACLQVKDAGCGMGRDTLSQLCKPFFTTKENSATGLGLSTVYGILSQYGGGLRVESEEGKGTSFFAYFRKSGMEWETAGQDALPQLQGSAWERETILLVEDDENIRKLVNQVLTAEGYRLLEASGARDALRVHEQHRDDIRLLLTDVVMPGISGRELAKTLHDLWPDLRIIFMSGYANDSLFQQGLESSQAQFLGKPFTPTQLLEKVRDALQTHPKSSISLGKQAS